MSKKAFGIGQVVYAIDPRRNRVMPLQIVEEITKRTMQGEETSYVVRVDAENMANLTDVASEVYETADQVKDAMVKRATTAIVGLIDEAVQNAELWFGHTEVRSPTKRSSPSKKADKQETIVELPDGTKAKVNLPDGFQ